MSRILCAFRGAREINRAARTRRKARWHFRPYTGSIFARARARDRSTRRGITAEQLRSGRVQFVHGVESGGEVRYRAVRDSFSADGQRRDESGGGGVPALSDTKAPARGPPRRIPAKLLPTAGVTLGSLSPMPGARDRCHEIGIVEKRREGGGVGRRQEEAARRPVPRRRTTVSRCRRSPRKVRRRRERATALSVSFRREIGKKFGRGDDHL